MITQGRLKEVVTYNSETGEFVWRNNNKRNPYSGKPAGCINADGYRVIRIDGVLYLAHRLAWLYVYGDVLENLDHINHDRSDNRILNLRGATVSENQKNQNISSANTSGMTGVCFDRWAGRWKAYVQARGKLLHLGRFDTLEQAAAARQAANIIYGYHENHGKNQEEMTV